jgi:hypothetical protein
MEMMFPFSTGQPDWAITFLLEKFNLKKYDEIIKFFNADGDYGEGTTSEDLKFLGKCHKEKISFLEIQDIGIQPMKSHELAKLKQKDDFTIVINDQKNKKKEPLPVKLDGEMTIKQFKSFMLTKTGNLPFFLKFHLNNCQTLSELVVKTRSWNM